MPQPPHASAAEIPADPGWATRSPARDLPRANAPTKNGKTASRSASSIAASLLVLVLFALPAIASATNDTRGEAERLFQIAELQYDGGEFLAAAETFGRAFQLVPSGTLALNAALSWENAGRLDEAREWFHRAGRHATDDGVAQQARRGISRIDAIRDTFQDTLEQRPSRLVISARPERAEVRLDGRSLGQTPLDIDIPAGLGILEVSAPGHVPYRERVAFHPAGIFRLYIPLEPAPGSTRRPARSAPDPQPVAPPPSPSRTQHPDAPEEADPGDPAPQDDNGPPPADEPPSTSPDDSSPEVDGAHAPADVPAPQPAATSEPPTPQDVEPAIPQQLGPMPTSAEVYGNPWRENLPEPRPIGPAIMAGTVFGTGALMTTVAAVGDNDRDATIALGVTGVALMATGTAGFLIRRARRQGDVSDARLGPIAIALPTLQARRH